jgi:hypothetical protein
VDGITPLPDPEEVFKTGIALFRKLPADLFNQVARLKSDMEDLLVWAGKHKNYAVADRISDLKAMWPTLILGHVKDLDDPKEQDHKKVGRYPEIKKTLVTRLRHFLLGNFIGLWRIVQQDAAGHTKKTSQKQILDPRPKKVKTEEEQKTEQADEAMRLARMGELKRSMEKTWEEALAEITPEVWEKLGRLLLTSDEQHGPHTQEILYTKVKVLLEEEDLILNSKCLEKRLRTAPKGKGPGPTGLCYEHLQMSLRYYNTWDRYVQYANHMDHNKRPSRNYHWLT